MTAIYTLHDPLVRKITAHCYNKFRLDAAGKPSKKKYVLTSDELMKRYGLIVERTLLKNQGKELDAIVTAPSFAEAEDGYQSDGHVAQVAVHYSASRAAPGSSPKAPMPNVPFFAPHTTAADIQLKLMHGELSNISHSLRVIANTIAGGSRASAKQSANVLLNTDRDEGEPGTSSRLSGVQVENGDSEP